MKRHSRHWRHSASHLVTNPPLYPPCYASDAVTGCKEGDALSTTFRVGIRYRCSISLPLASLRSGLLEIATVWEPDLPEQLSAEELNDYRRGRDALLAEAAKHIGGNVAVIEV
jgi:hypothetical protein